MIDLYLQAGNAGAFASACPWSRGEEEDGSTFWRTSGEGFAFDPIGDLVLDPGEWDEDGRVVRAPVVAEGWHANLRCTQEFAALVPEHFLVHPKNPRRVWA